jgi:uncharacterized protein (TIGR00159 family)
MDLMIGALAFLLIFAITSLLNLPILYKIMTHVANVAAIAALVIFQPELRIALSKLSLKGKKYKEITEFDRFLDSLSHSTYRLAEKRIGALIILEHEDRLDDFARNGVILNALFSSELLESIFATSTPLHDGAVLVRDQIIVAAAVILPLAEESSELAKTTGTRHRAALGITQTTDAFVIVISEKTGKVSLARDGIMTRGVKPDRFRGIIRSIFTAPEEAALRSKFSIKEWLSA